MAIAKVTIFLLFVAFSKASPYPKSYSKYKTRVNDFSWMVSLGYQESKNDVQRWNHICEGSILSDRTIITSGDCLDYINEDMIIKDVETKLQIRVGDEDLNDDHEQKSTEVDDDDDDDDDNDDDDDDDGVKVYFADGFRKHDSNVALIATNESIKFNDRVNLIALPKDDISYEDEIDRKPADLAMWNDDGELEEQMEVNYLEYEKDDRHFVNPMKTCKGFGASMVRREGPILIGILGKDPNCENEVDKDDGKFKRKFAKVPHPEVLKFIKDSKKDLELCQSLKDCFCELRDLRC